MKLRIAVISDLHCHPKSFEKADTFLFSDGARFPTAEHPVESLRKLVLKEKLVADVLVLPGDFTNKADLHGYVVGVHTARELANYFKSQIIVASLGNHDIDSRNLHKMGSNYLGEQLFQDFPAPTDDSKTDFFSKGFLIIQATECDFLVVNSVFKIENETKARRGHVSATQLEHIETALSALKKGKLRICVSHHHPLQHEMLDLGSEDLMEGGDPLIEMLEKNSFHLFIHGHKHHPRIRYTPAAKAGFPVFASGSLSAVLNSKFARSCRNTFHIIEIELHSTYRAQGIIYSWELNAEGNWIPAMFQSAGIAHKSGFGSTREIHMLAADIEKALQQRSYLSWEELVSTVPDLAFVIPAELQAIQQTLEPKGYKFSPEPRAPVIIGKTT